MQEKALGMKKQDSEVHKQMRERKRKCDTVTLQTAANWNNTRDKNGARLHCSKKTEMEHWDRISCLQLSTGPIQWSVRQSTTELPDIST